MGVDFYACDQCGDTFPDCGDYVSCDCGRKWCDHDCAEADGFEEIEECEDDCDECELECCINDQDRKSCRYCREEDYDDYELLQHVLSVHYENDRHRLIAEYKFCK